MLNVLFLLVKRDLDKISSEYSTSLMILYIRNECADSSAVHFGLLHQ